MTTTGRRADIRDVAREAEVSVTTVSHVLNNKGRVSSETRTRVRRVAANLGYQPSRSAQNLVNRRTGLLGLVVSSGSWEGMQRGTLHYFTQLMMGATTSAMSNGYALASLPAEKSLDHSFDLDGVIVVDPVSDDPLIQRLTETNVPHVTTGRDLTNSEATNWIDNDHSHGARLVLDHLYSQGARRIVLLCPAINISFIRDMEQAYRGWSAERGLNSSIVYTQEDSMERAGYDAVSNLLSQQVPPDAIFAVYTPLAFGAATAAAAAGVRIPEDLMVVMTATEELTTYQGTGSQITSLDLHPERLGHEAARLLMARIEGHKTDLPYLIEPDLSIRESTLRD